MSTPEKARDRERMTLARQLDVELQRRWEQLGEAWQSGTPPSAESAESIERISKLKALLPKPRKSGRWLDVVVLAFAALTMLACTLIRVPSTSIDLDVQVSRVKLDIAGSRSELLIPGELGEILQLSQARISQAEEILPPPVEKDSVLELRQLTVMSEGKAGSTSPTATTYPVRLHVVAIPQEVPVTMNVAMAYALDQRGLTLGAESTKPTRAQFGEVIELGPKRPHSDAPRRAIRPVIVSGKALFMDLYPLESQGAMTVFRDVKVTAIAFDNQGESSILAGQVMVKSGPTPTMSVQPSDRVEIRSKQPMLLRELTFDKTGLRVKLTATEATSMTSGDEQPRDLMPSVFDWLRFRWPTQLWGTLAALVTLWLAARRWWSSSE